MATKSKKHPQPEEDDDQEEEYEEPDDKTQFDPLAASLTSMEWLPRISVGTGLT